MSASPLASILVVEDDEGVAVLEKRVLERQGFGVLSVSSGRDALAAVQAGGIDLVVTDYCLQDSTTGLELLSQLKANGYDLPVIMVTGYSNEATAIECLRQGVRDFVPKTTEYLEYLPRAVERVLQAVRTEQRLLESETRFARFMDNSPAIAFLKDADGRLVYANRRFVEECQGVPWRGATDRELWSEETAQLLQANDEAVLQAQLPLEFHESIIRRDGTIRHWLTYRFPMGDGGARPLIGGMAADVTDQKTAQDELKIRDAQLRQSQKMEAVGQLAGGVAHDFNNLLTIILGYSDFLLQGLAPEGMKPTDLLQEIHRAGERAAMLTRQLLAFSRRQVLEPKHIDLNAVVRDMESMLRRLIGEDIEIRTLLTDRLATVLADPGQIEQVLLNLAVNARDAMPEGGELAIETSVIELDGEYVSAHAEVKPGCYVMIAVSDSGCGMDEETKSRIFEPFFTTKEVGKGTGLGLATVYGIVKQSNGFVWVYSEVGRGTTFKIYLPALEVATRPSGTSAGSRRELHGSETILLVEDDARVLAFSRTALEAFGYNVLEASDPLNAIQISESHAGTIHMLVTDVVMPQLNGRRLAEILSLARPEMMILYVSGYTDDAIVRQGILASEASFLQKPFTPQQLAAKLRNILDRVPRFAGTPAFVSCHA